MKSKSSGSGRQISNREAPWDRKLWAILKMPNRALKDKPMLIGQSWDHDFFKEWLNSASWKFATSPILFRTREQARAWCRGMHNGYALDGDAIVKLWRFKPVRVKSTLEVIP